jgi:uncharacterized protein (DUF433 family)
MSKVVSMRLKEPQAERLARLAKRMRRSVSETAAMLVDEALRREDFPFIEIRDTAAGRQAYLKGRRLAVWHIADLAQGSGKSSAELADYLSVSEEQIEAALRYAEAFEDEIQAAIEDNDIDPEELQRLLPGLKIVTVDASPPR